MFKLKVEIAVPGAACVLMEMTLLTASITYPLPALFFVLFFFLSNERKSVSFFFISFSSSLLPLLS